MRVCAIIAALVATVTSLVGAPQSERSQVGADEVVGVGLACGDGTFAPLAARSRGKWKALSEPDEQLSYFFSNLTRQALLLARQGWTLYPFTGGSSRAFTLKSPHGKGEFSECAAVQSFASSLVPLPPRRSTSSRYPPPPRAALGIGVFGPAVFERFEDVTDQPDEPSRSVAQLVVGKVHAEDRRLSREAGDWAPRAQAGPDVHPVVHLDTMVRHRSGDGEWYFFQASKKYLARGVYQGKNVQTDWGSALVHGWVRLSPDGLSATKTTGVLVDGDGKQGTWYKLVGLLRVDDREIWIAQANGYEWSAYELFEIGPGSALPHSILNVPIAGA